MKKTKPKSAKPTLNWSINKPASKEEILKTIGCARKLKRTPTFRDLKAFGIGRGVIERRWNGLLNALTATGVRPAARVSDILMQRGCWTGPGWHACCGGFQRWRSTRRLGASAMRRCIAASGGRRCQMLRRLAHKTARSGSGKTCRSWWQRGRAWKLGSDQHGQTLAEGKAGPAYLGGRCRWKSCCTNQ